MAFRRRGVVVPQAGAGYSPSTPVAPKAALAPGLRPSPLDGRLTTSTGTNSLDSILGGHSGLVTGTSLLIEESGSTDFAGALTRYYAAEGVVQGHRIHVFGMHEGWGRELPGAVIVKGEKKKEGADGIGRGPEERMKIAWRYERLGEFGGNKDRATHAPSSVSSNTAVFCHDFDLSKRLILPDASLMKFVPAISQPNFEFETPKTPMSPFMGFLNYLSAQLSNSPPSSVHRVVIPNLLSPAYYPPEASRPEHIIQFLHALRALLRQFSNQMTAIITIPLTLHPRNTGLTRWMELLSDGVLELAPLPSIAIQTKAGPTATTIQEDPPQGMLKIHRLPVFHEKGGGGGESSGFGDDLAFSLSRRRGLVIKPHSLPPADGYTETQQQGIEHEHGKVTKADIEF